MAGKQYCSIDPPFPHQAYMVLLFVMDGEDAAGIIPLTYLCRSPREIRTSIREVTSNMEEPESKLIAEVSIILPVTLGSRYPLKKEYWDNPTQHFDVTDRLRLFPPVVIRPKLYKLLVTPSYFDKAGRWHFAAALPLYFTAHDGLIDQFMKSSDYPVVEEAKYAALYEFGEPLGFNWKTGQITQSAKLPYIPSESN